VSLEQLQNGGRPTERSGESEAEIQVAANQDVSTRRWCRAFLPERHRFRHTGLLHPSL
jgi:hypothetical protein